MAGGIDDVDFRVVIVHGGVLGQDGNAALALQIVGVHHAVCNLLVLAENAALLEHFVYQGGLAVVNVGNNGNISQFLVLQW